MNLTLLYILAGVVIISLAIIMNRGLLLGRLGRKQSVPAAEVKEKPASKNEPVLARIYDNLRRAIYNEMVPGTVVDEVKTAYKSLGRRWNRDGQEMYAFCKKLDGDYIPTEQYMKNTRDNPPSWLHGALSQPYTAIAFNVKVNTNFMRKWGAVLLFAGFGIFAMVLLIAN